MVKRLANAGAVLVLAVASGCGVGVSPMEYAVTECGLEGAAGVRLGDGGNSLTVDTRGDEDTSGVDTADLACVLVELETPDHVIERMDTTRALDGSQTAQWDGLEGTWGYHPNTGMTFVVAPID